MGPFVFLMLWDFGLKEEDSPSLPRPAVEGGGAEGPWEYSTSTRGGHTRRLGTYEDREMCAEGEEECRVEGDGEYRQIV